MRRVAANDLRKKLVVLTKSLRYGIRKRVVMPALEGVSGDMYGEVVRGLHCA